MIPLIDLQWQTDQIKTQVFARLEALTNTSEFVLGSPVAQFEREYAAFLGVSHCIGVANGTDALEIALRALELPEGAEVLVPANSFIASALAVVRAGLQVRFVSIEESTQLSHAEQFEAALTKKTRVLMPVHLYGQCPPMAPILELAERHGLYVVEDCAQAQGAVQEGKAAGTFGHIAATSFYPGKNLGAWGDGGAVLTNDLVLAEKSRSLRNYGSSEKYIHDSVGFNSRLDSLQAIVLSEKLKLLDDWNRQRRELAELYDSVIQELPTVENFQTVLGNVHAYHLYVVRTPNRDEVITRLASEGIGSGIHYPRIIPDQLAFKHHPDFQSAHFENERNIASKILSLPLYPGMTSKMIAKTCSSLDKVIRTIT